MPNLKALRPILLSSLIGLVVGGGIASWFWMRLVERGMSVEYQSGILLTSGVLKQLRCGNLQAAILALEWQMDTNFIGEASMVRNGRPLDEAVRRIAVEEITERQKSGYEPAEKSFKKILDDSIDILSGKTSALRN